MTTYGTAINYGPKWHKGIPIWDVQRGGVGVFVSSVSQIGPMGPSLFVRFHLAPFRNRPRSKTALSCAFFIFLIHAIMTENEKITDFRRPSVGHMSLCSVDECKYSLYRRGFAITPNENHFMSYL